MEADVFAVPLDHETFWKHEPSIQPALNQLASWLRSSFGHSTDETRELPPLNVDWDAGQIC